VSRASSRLFSSTRRVVQLTPRRCCEHAHPPLIHNTPGESAPSNPSSLRAPRRPAPLILHPPARSTAPFRVCGSAVSHRRYPPHATTRRRRSLERSRGASPSCRISSGPLLMASSLLALRPISSPADPLLRWLQPTAACSLRRAGQPAHSSNQARRATDAQTPHRPAGTIAA